MLIRYLSSIPKWRYLAREGSWPSDARSASNSFCFAVFSVAYSYLLLQLCMALSKCIKLKWACKEAVLLCRLLFKNVLIMFFSGKEDDQLRRQNEYFLSFSKILNCLGRDTCETSARG